MRKTTLLCLVGALAAAGCGGPTSTRGATTAQPASTMWTALPEGWSELPPPPLIARPAARVWTGRELFIWSGYEHTGGTAPDQGAVFSPETNEWTSIASSPLAGRYSSGAVWTGSEVLIWGGLHQEQPVQDGAAYDPATDSWRELPESPLSARAPVATVWTGAEMIVWGSRDRPAPASDGAVYDPATNVWRAIAPAPIEVNLGTGVWTGTEMLVYGSRLDNNNRSDSGANSGAAYDPSTDSWRRLPETRLSPQATTIAWTGKRAVAWDYELQARAYVPATDSWEDIPPLPLDFSECYPSSVAVDSDVFGWFCGHAALFDDRTVNWTDISPDDPRLQPTSDVVAPVAAGSVVLLPGIRGEDESVLWAYKPPSETDQSTSGSDTSSQETARSASPDCGKTDITSDEYGTEIHPTEGPPGTQVTFSGTTLRGEDWKWAPSDRLEAWWNTELPSGGIRLVRVDDMERCRFETTFEIPEAPPGRYKISVFAWEKDPGEGYGFFLPHHFTVTDD